jgi:hypothetical protein
LPNGLAEFPLGQHLQTRFTTSISSQRSRRQRGLNFQKTELLTALTSYRLSTARGMVFHIEGFFGVAGLRSPR